MSRTDSSRQFGGSARPARASWPLRLRTSVGAGLVAAAACVALVAALSGAFSSATPRGGAASGANAANAANARTGAGASALAASRYGTCSDPSSAGALHVSGNRVLTAQGQPYTFYGITVYGGLEDGGSDHTWSSAQAASTAQVKAARYWHANTVRLQVSEEDLFNRGVPADGVNKPFLRAICRQVQLVRAQHMQAVISDNTEWPDWTERNPTSRTVAFWKVIGSVFGDEAGISFDLYNEPRLFYPKALSAYHGHLPALNPPWIWRLWRNGGKAAGTRWVGMQTLIDEIEKMKDSNLIWVEGPYYDDTLGLAADYAVKGKNIVWSLHHPALVSPTYWTKYFGYLSARYPMVDGEWSQYASTRPECRPTAYKLVPEYLRYLRQHNIGLLGWSLQPGAMLADPSHRLPSYTTVAGDSTRPGALHTPNHMPKNYACTAKDAGEGAGALVMAYLKRYSRAT